MKLHLLLVKNNVFPEQQIEWAIDYLEEKLGVKVEADQTNSDLPVSEYEQTLRLAPDGKPQWRLKELREQLQKVAPANTYHVVGFLYRTQKERVIAHSHSSLYGGADKTLYFEMPINWDTTYTQETIAHEIIHCLFGRSLLFGKPLQDPMDTLPLSNLGHVDEAIGLLKPNYNLLFHSTPVVGLYLTLVDSLASLVGLLGKLLGRRTEATKTPVEATKGLEPIPVPPEPEKPAESKLEAWAESIKMFEGWKEGTVDHGNRVGGSLTWRLNNPGAIKGMDGQFLQFENYEEGFNYLKHYLTRAATGKHTAYPKGGGHTLLEFQKIYSPSADHNEPVKYARYIAGRLGVSINQKIKTFV